MTAVFGDFLTPAGEHIAAATLITEDLTAPVTCGVIREVGRIVTTMAHYTGDLPLPDEFDAAIAESLDAETRTALDARLALRRGAQAMRHAITSLDDAITDDTHPVVRHLAAAATYLAAGRDLLQTHFATGPYRERQALSYWAPVITSTPVASALLGELADQALHLAPWAARVSLARTMNNGVPTPALLALNTASRCLWVAGATIEAAHRQHPSADTRTLLASIPVNALPSRLAPTGEEAVPALCDGLIGTAERLRYLVPALARHSRWSPAATSESWRKHALASAITGHTSEIVLRTLADRATQLGLSPTIHSQLLSAADATRQSWAASRALARAWDTLSTGADRHRRTTLVAAELGDLVLRAGRLAYNNAQWSPTCGDASRLRDPAGLAATAADLTVVVAALHHTAEAQSLVASTDYEAVRGAADDSRIYVATRLLTEDYDIPYRYSPAPASRVRALLRSYGDVNTAYGELLKTVSGLAKSCRAQSVLLDAVRPAALAPTTWVHADKATNVSVPDQPREHRPDHNRWHPASTGHTSGCPTRPGVGGLSR